MSDRTYQSTGKIVGTASLIVIIIVMLLALGLISCTKEPVKRLYTNTWHGVIIHDSYSFTDTTPCTRIFSDTLVKWWSAPLLFATIVPIDYQSYCITQALRIDTIWCYGSMAIREFEFTGQGVIKGDTLYESGTLFYTVKANGLTYNEKGKWSAKLTKNH